MKKKIAIIGGGIIGSTAACFLSQSENANDLEVTIFDDGKGQATSAAAGIISPWLSKRRNKKWYELAKDGANLIKEISLSTRMNSSSFDQSGTIITRNNRDDLVELYKFAKERANKTPAMGEVSLLSAEEVAHKIPFLSKSFEGLFVQGGSRINGKLFCQDLIKIAEKINLKVINNKIKLLTDNTLICNEQIYKYDDIIVATGAWVKETMAPLGINVKVRPQKGQLIGVSVPDFPNINNMPVLMADGEYDFIPLGHGKLIIGATHDDDQGFDLREEEKVNNQLLKTAQNLVNGVSKKDLVFAKVGTRAYTDDYSPFFGVVPGHPHLFIGSGLGSSGLTTGPMVGQILAEIVLGNKKRDLSKYEKSLDNYIN